MFAGSFYLPTNILLIAFFNYYYTFLQLDPDDVSEQLKRQGASIPLVRPGKSTAAFLKTVSFFLSYEMCIVCIINLNAESIYEPYTKHAIMTRTSGICYMNSRPYYLIQEFGLVHLIIDLGVYIKMVNY
jgi:preprotein translocase subunit SecY